MKDLLAVLAVGHDPPSVARLLREILGGSDGVPEEVGTILTRLATERGYNTRHAAFDLAAFYGVELEGQRPHPSKQEEMAKRREVVLHLFRNGFGTRHISEVTRIPISSVRAIITKG